MPEDLTHVTVSLEELRVGARLLADLAEEAKNKLASSDQVLAEAKSMWTGLRAADVYAAFADREIDRSKGIASIFDETGENVGHSADHYEATDKGNADALQFGA